VGTGTYVCCVTYNISGLDDGCDCYTQAWLNVSNETCAGELAGINSQYPGATMSTTCPP